MEGGHAERDLLDSKKGGAHMDAVQILIADDHDLIRRGLRTLLESHPGWKVCAEARDGADAISKAEKLKPHVAILDISMPELNGLDATWKIREVCPKTEVLALSVHYSDQLIRDMVEAGARGYIVKSDSDRDLVVAVEALSHHKPFFTSRATEVMSSPVNARPSLVYNSEGRKDRLTSRERQVVQLLSDGQTSKQVAARLHMSVKTAETHRANMMRKLELHSTSELVRYAVRNQVVEP
jgi:DNA-binding NarL/FixJ family response regulator